MLVSITAETEAMAESHLNSLSNILWLLKVSAFAYIKGEAEDVFFALISG